MLALIVFATAQDAKEIADKAIEGARAATGYHVKYSSTVKDGKGDPVKTEGEAVRLKEGVLYLQLTKSPKFELRAVRIGKEVFVHTDEGWLDSATCDRDAARGWQNPDEVLEVISKLTAGAKAGAGGTVTLTLDAAALLEVVGQELKDAAAEATLAVDGKKRLSKLTIAGKDGSGTTLEGEVSVVSYDTERSYTFKANGKEIPLDDEIRAKIEKIAPPKK